MYPALRCSTRDHNVVAMLRTLRQSPEQRQAFSIWLAMLGILATDIIVGLAISQTLTLPNVQRIMYPTWWAGASLLFVAVLAFLAAMLPLRVRLARRLADVFMAITGLHLLAYLAILVVDATALSNQPVYSLWDVALLYLMSVEVFTFIYWVLDIRSPGGAFLFPDAFARLAAPDAKPKRRGMVDYLFIAFNVNSTFGPTTETVKRRGVKLLMMLQTSIAVIIVMVILSRLT